MIFVIPSPSAEALVGFDDLAVALIGTLAAFGISFSAAGGIDAVGPWIVDRFEDFVDSAGDTLSSVVDNMRYGVNKAGDLIGNAYALSYNARFAQWLENEYSLTDNSIVNTSLVASIGHVPRLSQLSGSAIYNAGFMYCRNTQNNAQWYMASLDDCYFAVVIDVNSHIVYYCYYSFDLSLDSLSCGSYSEATGRVNSFSIPLFSQVSGGPLVSGFKYNYFVNSYSSTDVAYISNALSTSGYIFYSLDSLQSYLSSLSTSVPISISTSSISIPSVGDYSDEDGIIISGYGSWGDTLQDVWNKVRGLTIPDSLSPSIDWTTDLVSQLVDALVSAGELTTENSPGMFSPDDAFMAVWNYFRPTSLWDYVIAWVNSMSSGLSLIGGIMFSLPFVGAFYAVLAITLIYSFWRFLRDT